MSKIWDFPLQVKSREMIQMPKKAFMLSVVVKGDIPHLYVCTQDDADLKDIGPRIIRTVSAGEDFNQEGCLYIGTFHVGEWYVGHVFEQREGATNDPVSDRYQADMREVRYNAQANGE